MNAKQDALPNLDDLTAAQLARINENSYLVKHRKGEHLFRNDQPVSHLMYVRSGLIKLYKDLGSDKSLILKISGPGSYTGIISVFYSDRYTHSAAVLEDSEIVYISLPVFREIIGENGRFALYILRELSFQGIFLIEKMVNLSQKQIPGRIAEILLFFSRQVYMNNHFTLPVSRQELADLVSSTKESISRTLTEFKNDRLIEIDDRKVVLKSLDLLDILSRMG
jgi:CRP-like cAMP-binding protein